MSSLYDRASVIAGRSMTRSKAPDRLCKAWARGGLGAIIWDDTGREYLDMVCALGAISLGYRVRVPARPRGGVYSLPHVLEVEAAEAVLKQVAPWASSVRFVKSGSEATTAARMVAMAATGRQWIAMGDWAYHGWHDWCSAGSTSRILYPQGSRFEGLNGESFAAVFYEPPRFTPVGHEELDYLRWLRAYCTKHGIMLVYDEMIWGGRWWVRGGGLSEFSEIIPDMACYGKAFGNGEAAAFIVGNQALQEHGEIVSGTFSGDTTGLAAVLETLHTYATEPVIDTLWERARQLHDAFAASVPASFCTLSQSAPLMGLNFVNPAHRVPFKDAMHARGILIWQDWLMTMAAHTPEQMQRVADAAGEVAKEIM